MKTNEYKENRRVHIFIQICGLLSASLGFLAILGWIFDIPQLTTFAPGKIPMALSPAVLFVAYGLIIFFHHRIISNRIMVRVGVATSSTGILAALLFLYLSLNGIRPDVEHLSMKMKGAIYGLVVGYMSPITAFCFVLVGLSVLIMLTKPGQKKLIKTSLIFAVLVFFISIILLLSYLFGAPLLYEGSFIPPALTTSLAFLFLGIALLLMSGLKVWSYEELSDALSTRYTHILALVFIVLIVSVMTAGYSYYKNYEKQFRLGIEQQLSSIAELKVNELERWRNERMHDGAFFYRNYEFSNMVKRYFNNQNDLNAKNQIESLMRNVYKAYEYDALFLLDKKYAKKIVVCEGQERIISFLSQQSIDSISTGKVIFEDFCYNDKYKKIYLKLLIPIFVEKGKNNIIGTIILRIDPEKYLYPFIKNWPTLSKTAETLILRRDGNDALFLNELRFQKNTALKLGSSLTNKKMPAVQAALGYKGIMEGIDYRGIPVLAAIRTVPNSPWFLVAQMDTSEIYAPLIERLWFLVLFVFILIVGSGTIIGLIWRHQRVKFYKEKLETTEKLKLLSVRHEAILAAVPEIIMEVDNNKIYTWANTAGLEFFGDEVIGKDALFYFEGEQETYHTVKPLFDGSENIIYLESWQRRKNGEKRLLAWWCKVLKDENGKVTGALSSAQDITERKQIEEVLAQERYLMNKLMDNVPDHIYFKDRDSRFIRINNYNASKFGLNNPALAIGKTDFDFFMEEHARPAFEDEQTIIRTGKTIEGIEEKETWTDGRETWVLTTKMPLRDKEGNIIGTFGISHDITERKRAEIQIQYQANILTNISDAILATDRQFKIQYWNTAAEKQYGWTSAEVLGGHFTKFIRPLYSNDSRKTVMQKIMKKGYWSGELLHNRRDGTLFPVLATISEVKNAEGQIIGHVAINRDITDRKRAEEEITMLAHSLKSVNECVSITDMEDKIIFVNESFLKTYGYDENKLVGKHISIVRSLNNPPELVGEILPATLRGGWQGELLNKREDGSEFSIYLSTTILFDKEDKPLGLIGVATDITERKQAKYDLQNSLNWQEAIFEGSRDAIFVSDFDSRFVMVNQAACQLTGYSKQELLQMRILDLHELQDLQAYLLFHNKIMIGEEILSEAKILRKDGQKIDSEFSNKRIIINGVYYIHTSARDISERKRAEEDVWESEERFQMVFENVFDGIALYSEDPDPSKRKLIECNERYSTMAGRSRDELLQLGSTLGLQITLEDKANDNRLESLDSGKAFQGSFSWIRPDGKENVIEYVGMPITWRGKSYSIGIDRDITERKQADEEIRNAHKQLKQLYKHLDEVRENERAEISRNIHDDLGQSLTALKIDLHWTKENIGNKPGAKKKLNGMIDIVSKTIKRVQKISADLRPGMLDDLGLIPAIQWYSQEFEERTGLPCNLELSAVSNLNPKINLLLFRILQEGLTNIIRHANTKSVEVKLYSSPSKIFLKISDDGIGISKEKINSKDSLGLIGMNERIKQFNGSLEIISSENKGTSLIISIPIVD